VAITLRADPRAAVRRVAGFLAADFFTGFLVVLRAMFVAPLGEGYDHSSRKNMGGV
jgi:hypothetical protein